MVKLEVAGLFLLFGDVYVFFYCMCFVRAHDRPQYEIWCCLETRMKIMP